MKEQIGINKVAVLTEENDDTLIQLAADLHLPLIASWQAKIDYCLIKSNDALCLQGMIQGEVVQISADFLSGGASYRRRQGNAKNQAIAKAVGLRKIKSARIIDATAGLGGDAFVMACLGCEVVMLEHSPIVAALLADAVQRGLLNEDIHPIVARMKLFNVHAEKYFAELAEYPDVVYLDPMFPDRKKSARVKKEMQIFQKLLHHDEGTSLLDSALKVARSRVVVKRPKGAKYLNNLTPTHSIESKKMRYDVYLCMC